jgi:methionyl aminopeptidase
LIFYKSLDEIRQMRKSGLIVAKVLDHLSKHIKPGISTLELDNIAVDKMKSIEKDAVAAFKGYMGYPGSVCVSINSEVVHGIPTAKRIIKDGDIVSIDFGVEFDGYYGDAAFSKVAGNSTEQKDRLLMVTEKALYEGIKEAKIGNKLHDVSASIQDYVEGFGFGIVRDFVGHGIGRSMHESPQIPNYGEKGTGPVLMDGMTLAIEPMVTLGSWEVKTLDDGWTAVTVDGSLAAHFEHSVAITREGTIILTEL